MLLLLSKKTYMLQIAGASQSRFFPVREHAAGLGRLSRGYA